MLAADTATRHVRASPAARPSPLLLHPDRTAGPSPSPSPSHRAANREVSLPIMFLPGGCGRVSAPAVYLHGRGGGGGVVECGAQTSARPSCWLCARQTPGHQARPAGPPTSNEWTTSPFVALHSNLPLQYHQPRKSADQECVRVLSNFNRVRVVHCWQKPFLLVVIRALPAGGGGE